jgi:tRNA dimethylallyltransferase
LVGPDPLVDAALRTLGDDVDVVPTVVGPTGSGKTELAVRLAERLGGEIIGVDSVQIYRGFDIGSGRPSAEELARAPHHLVGILEPNAPVDAARFARMADDAITAIRARGRRPILCGGTFLWTKAVLFGLADAPAADDALRERHRVLVATEGRRALHDALARVDPEAAAKLHPNDVVRVSRALEVIELTGKSLLAWQRAHAFGRPNHRGTLLAVRRTNDALTARITERVRAWLAHGWLDEVRALVAQGHGESRAMGSVGYREVRAHLAGELTAEELPAAIVRATRVFARRQRTWLNHEPVTWLEAS